MGNSPGVSKNRVLRGSCSYRLHDLTEFGSVEYAGSATITRSSLTSRPVTTDASKYGAPSRTRIESSSNTLYTAKVRCSGWVAVTYASDRKKKGITILGDHARETRPAALPEYFDRQPRTVRNPRGLTWTDFLVWSRETTMASISRRFFRVPYETFLACQAHIPRLYGGFLTPQFRFFEQPPTTRDRVVDSRAFVEILQDEYWRPRRRIETNFLG